MARQVAASSLHIAVPIVETMSNASASVWPGCSLVMQFEFFRRGTAQAAIAPHAKLHALH